METEVRDKSSQKRFYSRRKLCQPCADKKQDLDYKDIDYLKKFLSDRYMIEARRRSGMCGKCQRAFARAVKRARQVGLIPYSPAHKGVNPVNFKR